MLITICYSVLTWIQSRQRTEISSWIQECCSKEKGSIVFVRDRILLTGDDSSEIVATSSSVNSFGVSRSESSFSFGESPSRNISRSSSVSVSNSNFSSPRRDFLSEHHQIHHLPHHKTSSGNVSATSNKSWSGSTRQISDLCYNHESVTKRKLLWEEDRTRAIVLFPHQTVELHDWTAFRGTKVQATGLTCKEEDGEAFNMFYILLEAEPGSTQRHQYRKFHQFGHITAWKCGAELALILLSDTEQVIELMHIFRLGQIILEGGWRVYRLTTINCVGTVGTQISRSEVLNTKTALTPGDLRRLSAGIYENRENHTGTPKNNCIPNDAPKHDITTINEEILEEISELDNIVKTLPNWYERSPKKRPSIAAIPTADKPNIARRRVSSFCSGSLSNLSNRSSSLASLLMCSKSMSVEEEPTESVPTIVLYEQELAVGKKPTTLVTSGRQSYDSLSSTPTDNTVSRLQSPTTNLSKPITKSPLSLSTSPSPKKSSAMIKKSPNRLGKPPNILVLCECDKRREEIANVLKAMLANDRYVIYDIRWDQLVVGGWSDQTALLVVSGKIPENSHISLLLQFLGDGGKLLAWCCETHPFGPTSKPSADCTPTKLQLGKAKKVILYGATQNVTDPLFVSNKTWGTAPESRDNHPPSDYQRILETNDSEGYSRPLTVSVYGKVKGTNETAIIQLDGGALGGKAILSQVHFESSVTEDSCLALLSTILTQNLGIDCTRIKAPEYSPGFLLGDHKKIMDFLAATPSTIQQSELTVEFTPRGEKGSLPSHMRFPIKTLECPENFSTLEYFNNISSKELGRLVIYTDVITSTMNVLNGHPLQHGLVVIARRQTAGKGRGKNVWLSPEGCACFALQLNINMDSQMGRRITLFQHIAALAVILAVPNHKEINLRVKWPNDIYVDDQKIGGIRVDTRLEGKVATVVVGIGVNVSNAYPTVCLNSVLYPEVIANASANKKVKVLTTEKVIATTLTELEKLLEIVDNGHLDQILNLYAENWIHNMDEGDTVNVEVSEGSFAECIISGIDEFGFLRVTEVGTGHVFSVRPDGNSFDIANKLIAIKD